ncbi:DNA-directed RNA polymerase I subunit RPA43 [Amyelois transitella]|uniref:DNA-directed RNA polymerase I subunit RPA43 n=1 Tax=Amyelois transitella TaxID=680683 RepID=UPI00299016A8|nr:DNA-directed RNA polymerase I subunit RPA43 [Amyelois transitella]
MSTIIKFELKELRKLANDKDSCVVEKKVTQNLALQPWCLGNLKESIKNLLDYKIGKYDKEFNGILLSYKNLRILQNIGSIRNDNADINFQVQADYFIFRPYVGAMLKGVINRKSHTHLGILVHRVFNVVIPRPTEEPGNKWIGSSVHEGQPIAFRVVVLDLYGALPYIRGELDERFIKLGLDGHIDNIDNTLHVNYVDFEKTKPFSQKQSGDGLPESTSKNVQKVNAKQQSNRIAKINGKPTPEKNKNSDKDNLSVEKDKNKRQSKVLEADSKQQEPNSKQSKKHKKDI